MSFRPNMTSRIEGISVLDALRWRRWSGAVADVWHAACAAGARGEYVSQHPRLFVVLDREGGDSALRLSARGTDLPAPLTAHAMSYIPAGVPIWSRVDASMRIRHLDIHFDVATLAERIGEAPDRTALATPRLQFTDERLFALARLIAEDCCGPDARHDVYGDSLVTALFVDLMRLGPSPALRRRSALSPRQLGRATAYIEENCLRALRLQELADLIGLSQSYFSHAFKAATGVPPYQWHMQARIRKVQEMLAGSALPLTEIAVSAGFADQAHLTRVFRRHVGTTPAAWRRDVRT
ncbi:AraC family transcriptional regulator [Rhodoplanes sp. TEM]|uniref:AraC family transcriptional regulator n=1 Tax=Rhodoplanes tepidamans TaxID=200616 RepID=A0ABT5JCP2_RHOTP|nr:MULTISPECIES: AraC family transcriptional regulator [Rhodoplanes]MDC7787394.1 AraC family transcriptional regulator [Rhodoplanes tepidamans]MDC7985513.1 AraC family transcriptional regulator [Rhodoplanes sp. TEM]MDQ0358120.1 AraC-like DNA-binding protein [Rhodoplanes tepidamans]